MIFIERISYFILYKMKTIYTVEDLEPPFNGGFKSVNQ